jgi:hypothetical protein
MEIKSRKKVKTVMREEAEEEGMKGRRKCIFFRARTFGRVGGHGVHVQGHAGDAGKYANIEERERHIKKHSFWTYFFAEFEVESGVV